MAVNFFPEDSGSSGSGGGSTGNYIPLTQKGTANGVATLDASAKVPQSQLPNISITDTFVVATETEMLALNAQTGDIAVRTDTNKTLILKTSPATVLANWVELPTPTNGVFSVDGNTGAVVLTNTYQAKNNELTALSVLTDTPGFIKKVGDGVYAVDTTAYLSVADASMSYQPLNSNLTSISGITGTYGFLVKTLQGWELNTSGFQHASPLLTGIANLAGDGYLEKVGTGWALNPGPFQRLHTNLTGISAISADGFLTRAGGVWGMDVNKYQYADNELSGFSVLPDEVGLVKKTGDGTYVLDKNTYLTTASATANYQPLNTNLTGISGLAGTSGVPRKTAGVWSLDATSYLTGNQVITLSGDISGSGTTAITATLANVATAGSYSKVTINTKGLVTSGANLTATDIPNLDWAKITTGKPTTLAGYNIGDAYTKTETDTAISTYGYSKQTIDTSLAGKQNTSNELSGFIALADTAGFIRKTGDGTYSIDTNTYLTSASVSSSYQPLNTNLTGISGITGTSGFIKQTNGVWSLDASNYITGNQTITLSGDATGSGTTSIAVTIPSLPWSKISSKPTTILGYGIVDAYTKTEVDASLAGKQNTSNELAGFIALPDTNGLIRKTGDGTYSLDNGNYLTGNQTITLSGDVSGSGTTTIPVTLPNVVTAGSSAKPIYNAKGLITGSGALLASDIPALDATKITNTAVTLSDTQTVTGQKTLTGGVIINDTITESSISTTELFTSWQSATGWTINGANATHTTGTTAINATVGTITTNEVYQLVVTITGRTLGNVVITFGGNTSAAITTTTTFHLPVISTTSPSFLPTTDFDGVVSLSVRLITPSSIFVSGLNGIKGRFVSSFIGLGTDKYRIQNLNNTSSAFGVNAGRSSTTGGNWSAFGGNAGYSNTTGINWSAFGGYAGYSNTTGSNWSAFGGYAGYANTTGSDWSAFGVSAGLSSTTGSNWSAFGANAGRSNTTGSNWSAFGGYAGGSNTTGDNWSAFGLNAGLSNTTGSNWSAFGVNAGLSNTGSGGIFLGFEAGYNSTNESNCLYIGNNRNFDFLKGDGINQASTAVLRVNGTVASTSTTTGALVVSGGVGCQALFATSLNGQLVLNRFTTATRPVASAGTLGQVWLNTDTGKIEYVATSSTIQVITST